VRLGGKKERFQDKSGGIHHITVPKGAARGRKKVAVWRETNSVTTFKEFKGKRGGNLLIGGGKQV